jgi:transcriptional regulator with XRE-family HTH domain
MGDASDPRIAKIGLKVKKLREDAKPRLTQEEFAHRSGVTLRHLQRIEAGSENPTAGTLLKIADALGVQVSLLLGEMSEQQDPAPHPDPS